MCKIISLKKLSAIDCHNLDEIKNIELFWQKSTGKSLSEALIFASINPQYDNRLFMELPWKIKAQNMGRTCSVHVLSMACACSFHGT